MRGCHRERHISIDLSERRLDLSVVVESYPKRILRTGSIASPTGEHPPLFDIAQGDIDHSSQRIVSGALEHQDREKKRFHVFSQSGFTRKFAGFSSTKKGTSFDGVLSTSPVVTAVTTAYHCPVAAEMGHCRV